LGTTSRTDILLPSTHVVAFRIAGNAALDAETRGPVIQEPFSPEPFLRAVHSRKEHGLVLYLVFAVLVSGPTTPRR
jgi:hypothetical protein